MNQVRQQNMENQRKPNRERAVRKLLKMITTDKPSERTIPEVPCCIEVYKCFMYNVYVLIFYSEKKTKYIKTTLVQLNSATVQQAIHYRQLGFVETLTSIGNLGDFTSFL